MGYILKLAEKKVGERMLVACMWKEPPPGTTDDSWIGCRDSEYEEHMIAVIMPEYAHFYCRNMPNDVMEKWGAAQADEAQRIWNEWRFSPLTEGEKHETEKLIEKYSHYQGESIRVGGKDYSIYDANNDHCMPCGNAPKIKLTDEEAAAWRNEFAGKPEPGDYFSYSGPAWYAFNDDLFLK
jgi:hypothetical protein